MADLGYAAQSMFSGEEKLGVLVIQDWGLETWPHNTYKYKVVPLDC